MDYWMWVRTWILISLLLCNQALGAQDLVGRPRVVDGDGLEISGVKIRLVGIDAPETNQSCLNKSGAVWPCGVSSKEQLATLIGNKIVTCKPEGNDRLRRTSAVCCVEGRDINQQVLRTGFSLAFRHFLMQYLADEVFVRPERKGLWEGSFAAP